MSWLWGRTGHSFVDVWTLVHFCFWVFIGSGLWSLHKSRPVLLGLALVGAFVWEVFERYAEKKWPALWLNPESWWNAWVSDPLTCVFGLLFIWYALDHWRTP